ncbi:MAG: hypothetical protein HYU04_01620 [Candidatus Wildermuthbacteria bacterium]|nr:hypothetical protein [Candidatus Wildermuthbacteria bacterium]
MHAVVVLLYLFLFGGLSFRKGKVGDWLIIDALPIACVVDGNRQRITPTFIFAAQNIARSVYRTFWPLEPVFTRIRTRELA